ncbi:MAG: helix-turn-helix transcriptional regulator [Desulfuromonas sp.]
MLRLGFRVTEEKRQKYKHCSQELLGVLAANIIRLRREQGLSQEALAEKSGMHRTFISLIERRGRNITLGAVEALAEALGVRAYELLMADGMPHDREAR